MCVCVCVFQNTIPPPTPPHPPKSASQLKFLFKTNTTMNYHDSR